VLKKIFKKDHAPIACQALLTLMNLLLEFGVWPSSLELGVIVPIFKKQGNTMKPDNYRPISLLTSISKVYELILNKRLCTYVEENNILSEEQAGFRKDRSTIDHILTLDTLIATRLNMKQETFIAFLVGGLRQYVGFLKGQYSHQSSSTYSLMTRGKFNIRKSNIVTLPRKPGKDRKNQDGIR